MLLLLSLKIQTKLLFWLEVIIQLQFTYVPNHMPYIIFFCNMSFCLLEKMIDKVLHDPEH